MVSATLIKFPLLFISGVFVPIEEVGKFRVLSFLSPLTYYTDLVRRSVQGVGYFSQEFNLLMLFSFTVILFFIAVFWHKKSLSKRF